MVSRFIATLAYLRPSVCVSFFVCLSPLLFGNPNSSFDPAPSRIVAICHKAGRNIEAREDPLLLTHHHPTPAPPSLPPSIPSLLPPTQPHLPRFHYRCKRYPVLISGFSPLLIIRAIMMPMVISALPKACLRSDEDPTRGSMDTFRCSTLIPSGIPSMHTIKLSQNCCF